MKLRTNTALALGSVLLAGGLLAGCSGNGNDAADNGGEGKANTAASAQQNTTDTAAAPKVNEFGWTIPDKTITVDYYTADKDNPDKVAKKLAAMHDYLLKNFNVDVKKTQYDVDGKEKLNLMLASNDYPGVMSAIDSDTIDKWRSQGKLIDLAPLVDNTAPTSRRSSGTPTSPTWTRTASFGASRGAGATCRFRTSARISAGIGTRRWARRRSRRRRIIITC